MRLIIRNNDWGSISGGGEFKGAWRTVQFGTPPTLTPDSAFFPNFGPNAITELTGSGTPEGSITAPPGSTYKDLSGGSGATFYVKETGTGNTGWAAK